MAGFLALGASLQLLKAFGLRSDQSALADRILSLADQLVAKLKAEGATLISPHAGANRSGIVTFAVPGQAPDAIRRAALDAQVVVSCRGGGIRASLHAYNNDQDIDRLISVVHAITAR